MEFSKKLLIGLGSGFSITIFAVLIFIAFGFDMSIIGPSLFVAGSGLLGVAVRAYYKKAQAENIVKLQTSMYKTTVDENLRYNEGNAIINQKYNVSNESFECSPIEQMKNDALGGLQNTLTQAFNDATSPIENSEY